MWTETVFFVAIFAGVGFSLLYAEITGVIPAGMVVPGYLVLILDYPLLLMLTVLFALGAYIIVMFGLSRFIILYGRRKFSAMILVGMLLNLCFCTFVPNIALGVSSLSVLGFIVPGLLANTIQRQGFSHTVLSTMLVTTATFTVVVINQTFFVNA